MFLILEVGLACRMRFFVVLCNLLLVVCKVDSCCWILEMVGLLFWLIVFMSVCIFFCWVRKRVLCWVCRLVRLLVYFVFFSFFRLAELKWMGGWLNWKNINISIFIKSIRNCMGIFRMLLNNSFSWFLFSDLLLR